ncbi:hypothetical protein PPH41_04530 [Burkholderia gladioli]|uniref:hypothetical protein n=2 Tax=Burkholderia gladioli TaxID=28095 RepID=UPI00163FD6B0|nr:hypothetical protein [Burkholderia gladioli]MDC6127257.1 hypothetical protein [Burkholderia gladioli]
MFKLTVECGPTPAYANAAQIGDEDYRQRSKAECKAWMAQLARFLGEPPEGARLIILASRHDYGTYYEVAVRVEAETEAAANPEAVDYAYRCEGEAPTEWDVVARRELDAAGLAVRDALSADGAAMPATTVQDQVNMRVWGALHAAIWCCDADSQIGEACTRLLNLAERILAGPDLEPEFRDRLKRDAIEQCRIWFFG